MRVRVARCCDLTIARRHPLSIGEPIEGTRLDCDFCDEELIVHCGVWTREWHPSNGPNVPASQLDPALDAERHKRADEVTDGKFSKEWEQWK